MLALLYQRYSQVSPGNGPRYVLARHVRSGAGFYARRTIDLVVMDTWPSSGLPLHGHEIKCSRSDWLRELKDPAKAEEFRPYMTYWWLVVPDAKIVRPGELPDGWGLLVRRGPSVAARVPARKNESQRALGRGRLAALLRATQATGREHGHRLLG